MDTAVVAIYLSSGSLTVAVGSFALTWWRARSNAEQVKVQVRQALNAETQTVLQRTNLFMMIEGRISEAMRGVEDASVAMEEAKQSGNQAAYASRATLYESRKEAYLNQLDRLATETNKNSIDFSDVCRDYRDVIRSVIKVYPDKFGPGTEFRELVKLHATIEETLDRLPSSITAETKR